MSVTLFDHQPAVEAPQRRRFTRSEYHWLLENGLFEPEQRYELMNGDINEKMRQKEPHPSLMMQWVFALSSVFGAALVRCRTPVVLSDFSEPEPDITVTSQHSNVYRDSGNTSSATDALLIIEVCVSSFLYDSSTKAMRYAQSGIPDYWALDVEGRRLIVHRDPTPDGYTSVVAYAPEESVSPLAAPDAAFLVGDFLP